MSLLSLIAFVGKDYNLILWIVSLVLSVLFFAIFDLVLFRAIRRKPLYCYFIFFEVVILVSSCFEGLEPLVLSSVVLLLLGGMAALLANVPEYRYIFGRGFKGQTNILQHHGKKTPVPEKLFDRDALYEKVFQAVLDMSRLKQGALITFMKEDNLLDDSKVGTIIKQRGVDVDAPVTPELLETIFYVGTRLHDGAVIIKDDKIARAAVFFQSTERPLTGKYGSRHQAALGISENSDSVTVVVSEETGRISIAFQGELTPVTPDNFLRVFEDDMAYTPEPKEEDEEGPLDHPVHD